MVHYRCLLPLSATTFFVNRFPVIRQNLMEFHLLNAVHRRQLMRTQQIHVTNTISSYLSIR